MGGDGGRLQGNEGGQEERHGEHGVVVRCQNNWRVKECFCLFFTHMILCL